MLSHFSVGKWKEILRFASQPRSIHNEQPILSHKICDEYVTEAIHILDIFQYLSWLRKHSFWEGGGSAVD
jgi:hypothetical protein